MSDKKPTKSEHPAKLVYAGSLHPIHWIVVGLSVLPTIAAWSYLKSQLNQDIYLKFEHEAQQVISLVKDRMELYKNTLWGSVAFIDSRRGIITYDAWLAYANSLKIGESYPDINGLGVIHYIKESQLEIYLSLVRRRRPEFVLRPN